MSCQAKVQAPPSSRPARKPAWLKKKLPVGGEYQRVRALLAKSDTSTFMILGAQCTRDCRFCNVTHKTPTRVDPQEPQRVADAAKDLGLKYVVVTSVTRDDLPDGGAAHFAATIQAIKTTLTTDQLPPPRVEVLIPDLQGDRDALKVVIDATPDVLNHNIETVSALYHRVRPQAIYQRSLELLATVKTLDPEMPTKSGIMVGLGETMAELEQTMADLRAHHCDILTIGQYLQPTRDHLPVSTYYTPQQFKTLETKARQMGFKHVASGPHVRSSYQAQALFES